MKGLLLSLLVCLGLLAGCEPPDPEHMPDVFLRDSLGLTDDDAVWTVRLEAADGGERAMPAELRIPPGAWVQFVTGDGRLHTVRFRLGEIAASGSEFLVRTGQEAGPPLLERGSRLVVTFEGAPPGRYPYRVEGNGDAGEGVIVVSEEGAG